MRKAITISLLCVFVTVAGADDVRQQAWVAGGGVSVQNFPPIQTTSALPAFQAVLSVTGSISITPVQLVAANIARKGLILYNNSTTPIYIAYDTTVSSATHMTYVIAASSGWAMPQPVYQGAITGVRGATGDGKILVTDLQ